MARVVMMTEPLIKLCNVWSDPWTVREEGPTAARAVDLTARASQSSVNRLYKFPPPPEVGQEPWCKPSCWELEGSGILMVEVCAEVGHLGEIEEQTGASQNSHAYLHVLKSGIPGWSFCHPHDPRSAVVRSSERILIEMPQFWPRPQPGRQTQSGSLAPRASLLVSGQAFCFCGIAVARAPARP